MFSKINKNTNIQTVLGNVEIYLKDFSIAKTIKMEIKTIVSEIIYNIKKYTPSGSLKLKIEKNVLYIHASDHGLGIDDINMAIKDGYSTSGTLGLGFASLFRLSDEIDIQTSKNGTTINIIKSIV